MELKKNMVDGVVTDTYALTIDIIAHGFADIVDGSVVFPAAVEANTPFDILYDVKNTGTVQDMLYGHLLDADDNEIVGSDWTLVVDPDDTITRSFTHPGISGSTTFKIEVGHSPV